MIGNYCLLFGSPCHYLGTYLRSQPCVRGGSGTAYEEWSTLVAEQVPRTFPLHQHVYCTTQENTKLKELVRLRHFVTFWGEGDPARVSSTQHGQTQAKRSRHYVNRPFTPQPFLLRIENYISNTKIPIGTYLGEVLSQQYSHHVYWSHRRK